MVSGREHDCHACTEYNALSRRSFLATGGAAAAAAALSPAWLPRVSLAKDHRGAQRDVVLSIYLRGGADGLTMCVPWGDPSYYTARSVLAIPRPDSGQLNRATDLDGFFGLPPALTPLLPAYNNGHLLIVHACSSQDTSRSHFDAQRNMEVGRLNDPTLGSGWLGRHLASVNPMNPAALLRGVGISTGLQRTLQGGPKSLPIPDLDVFGLTGDQATIPARRAALSDMYSAVGAPLNAVALDTLGTIDLLNTINFATYAPGGSAVYPNNAFGYSLKTSAALIRAQVGVEAIAVDVNGWDTHNDQGPTGGIMANLMTTLAQGLAAFYQDLVVGNGPSFTAVVMSEFGRRVRENASAGTDHGFGGTVFVLGQPVLGRRVLTQWPGLHPDQLFQGLDLRVTIDYRDVLAEIVQRRLGNTNLPFVFPGYTPTFRGVVSA